MKHYCALHAIVQCVNFNGATHTLLLPARQITCANVMIDEKSSSTEDKTVKESRSILGSHRFRI